MEREFLHVSAGLLRHDHIMAVLSTNLTEKVVNDVLFEVGMLLASINGPFGQVVLPSRWSFSKRPAQLADLRLTLLSAGLDSQERAYGVAGDPRAYRDWLRKAHASVGSGTSSAELEHGHGNL